MAASVNDAKNRVTALLDQLEADELVTITLPTPSGSARAIKILKRLLCDAPTYFVKAFGGQFIEGSELCINLRDDQPEAAGLFIHWIVHKDALIDTERIRRGPSSRPYSDEHTIHYAPSFPPISTFRRHHYPSEDAEPDHDERLASDPTQALPIETYVRTWIMGDKYGVHELQNAIMRHIMTYRFDDVASSIDEVYATTQRDSPFRRAMATISAVHCWREPRQNFEAAEAFSPIPDFAKDFARAQFRILTHEAGADFERFNDLDVVESRQQMCSPSHFYTGSE